MIGLLAEHYGWGPRFWEEMGWRELRAWIRERARSVKASQGRDKTEPETWAGQQNDGWWDEQRERIRRMRGH